MSVSTGTPLGVAGPYDLVRKLGAGGMGEVFLARHRVLGREAVIKRILAEHTENPELVRRFVVEAQAAGRLSHRNVVEVLDVAQTSDGKWYLVLEYLKGLSLADWMNQWSERTGQPVGPWYATIILAQAANALRVAHAAGIVHRDFKPENIFLTNATLVPAAAQQAKALQQVGLPVDLFVKLLDFGIAKLRGVEGPATQTGVGIGTIAYMAPEQFENAKDVDDRADVYALGVVAFQLLTGGLLPWGENTPAVILYKRQTTEPPPDARSLVPSLSSELAAVVRRALSRSPRERPSAHEFALAFAREVHAHGGLPSGMSLVGAYAEELLTLPAGERTVGRIEIPPHIGQPTAPLRPKAPATPVPVLPSPTPWMTPPVEPTTPPGVTTHSSAVQVLASAPASPIRSRKGLLLSVGTIGVIGGAVALALMAGGKGGDGPTAASTAPSADPGDAASLSVDAAAPAPVDAGAAVAVPDPPVDAAAPVDAQAVDAGRGKRVRPPKDKGDGQDADRGFRDLTK